MKIRRILSATLAMALTATVLPMSVNAAQPTDSKVMATALTAVKQRIDIPAELTEFTSSAHDYNGVAQYSFNWANEDYSEDLTVSCNENGQILTYSRNRDDDYGKEQKLPTVKKEDAVAAAETFLKKSAPETVENESDRLVYVNASGGDNDRWWIEFHREKDGVQVVGNGASVNTSVTEDGEIYVANMTTTFSYGAEFETAGEEIAEPEAKYKETYPAEPVYRKKVDYALYRETGEYETQLVYRVKDSAPGYISAYTGDVVEQKFEEYGAMGSGDSGALANQQLSKEEIAELDTVAGLYTVDEAERFLKSVPQLKIPKSYTVTDSGMYTSVTGRGDDAKKDYSLSVNMSDADSEKYSGGIYARFDAQRDRLTYYSGSYSPSYDPDKDMLTDKEVDAANKEIDAFVNTVLPDKITEFEKEEDTDAEYTDSVYVNYTRMVNGIPYLADYIGVRYDAADKKIAYYNLGYDDDAAFDRPEGALSAADAYGYLTEIAPVKKYYVYDGEKYRLVYGMDGNPMVDAFTGEDVNADDVDYTNIGYNDIDGHWCEEAVTALADYGIGLPGESFKPDAAITQAELLRLLVSGIEGKYFVNYDDEEIYDYCFRNQILEKDERSDNAVVPRETAFVYMIRLAGYEKVAALSDIYNVEYADGGELSDGLIGYAAILSGMGIVAGDGGYLRPKDDTTRAETAMMLYRYMK